MSVGFPKNDYVLTVYAFLGSATFTALFFLLQSKDTLKNYDLFVFITSLASILFILAVVGRLNISNGNIRSGTIYSTIVGLFALFGFISILSIIVLLVIEINFVLGIIVGVSTCTLYVILDMIARKSH
jgi:hypothetical protein